MRINMDIAKEYIGTKRVKATPMTRLAYNEYRGRELPADENGDDEGYLVEYTDGGKQNVAGHDGYVSWSPKEQFDNAYRETSGPANLTDVSYSVVLAWLRSGSRFARKGWNGKDMFIFLVPGSTFKVNREPLLSILGEGTEVEYRPHIDIKNVDGSIAVWTPSITDQMATDWYSV